MKKALEIAEILLIFTLMCSCGEARESGHWAQSHQGKVTPAVSWSADSLSKLNPDYSFEFSVGGNPYTFDSAVTGRWHWLHGAFHEQSVGFNKKSSGKYRNDLVFCPDGRLEHDLYHEDCFAGVHRLLEGDWCKDGRVLYIQAKGIIYSGYEYALQAQYFIDTLSVNEMRLELIRTVQFSKW